ncbi:MAG: phosphate ABC transporter permease PstA [Dehalococcoidia bacterium]
MASIVEASDPLRKRRHFIDHMMTVVMVGAAVVGIIPLILILFYLLKEGIPGLSLDLFTEDPNRPGLEGGGVRHSIVGSAMIVGVATLIGVPVAIGCGIFLSEFGQNRLGTALRFLVDVLAGIPSITMGLFVYGLVVLRQGSFSGFAGGLALAILFLPIVARITEEMMLLVPRSIREASLALGAPAWMTAIRIVVPTALPGIATGVLLALSRIAGEAAPLLFTTLGNQFYSTNLSQAMDALPLRIFVYAVGPYEYWHEQAWAMSLILVTFILVVSLIVRAVIGTRVVVRS